MKCGIVSDFKQIDNYFSAAVALGSAVPCVIHYLFTELAIPHPDYVSAASFAAGVGAQAKGVHQKAAKVVKRLVAQREFADLPRGGKGLVSYANYRLDDGKLRVREADKLAHDRFVRPL